jgi:hypothetical protein
MLKELFSLLLARELGLTAPEPVLVELQEGFDWGPPISGSRGAHPPKHRLECGHHPSGRHDWKPWIQGSAPRSIPNETLESAYAFDAMVQNSDRMADNPELALAWRGTGGAGF